MQIDYVLRPDWRYQKSNGKFPFRLWVSHLDERRDYQVKLEVSRIDFEKLSTGKNLACDLKQLRDDFRKIQTSIENFCDGISEFDFEIFQDSFINYHPLFVQRKKKVAYRSRKEIPFDYSIYEKRFPILKEVHPRQDSISVIFQFIIKSKLRYARIGTATAYQTAYNAFKRFQGNVTFRQVTKNYLLDFKHSLLNKNASLNTVGIYCRNMRTCFNEAIEQNVIKRDKYPFGRRRFLIPEISRKKPVVSQNYIPIIMNYTSDDYNKVRARDLWMFLYQANGMNVKDLCFLKHENIKGFYFSFIRAKVENTSASKSKEVNVYITENMWQTIKLYGNKLQTPESYVFPFLTSEMNPIQVEDRIETIIYQINRSMKIVFEELHINQRSSTLLTRYSIANHLKEAGASTEVIKDLLGHASVKTTEIYLNSFEVNIHGDYIRKLMDKHSSMLPSINDGQETFS